MKVELYLKATRATFFRVEKSFPAIAVRLRTKFLHKGSGKSQEREKKTFCQRYLRNSKLMKSWNTWYVMTAGQLKIVVSQMSRLLKICKTLFKKYIRLWSILQQVWETALHRTSRKKNLVEIKQDKFQEIDQICFVYGLKRCWVDDQPTHYRLKILKKNKSLWQISNTNVP